MRAHKGLACRHLTFSTQQQEAASGGVEGSYAADEHKAITSGVGGMRKRVAVAERLCFAPVFELDICKEDVDQLISTK